MATAIVHLDAYVIGVDVFMTFLLFKFKSQWTTQGPSLRLATQETRIAKEEDLNQKRVNLEE
jgi:hypothetical protein